MLPNNDGVRLETELLGNPIFLIQPVERIKPLKKISSYTIAPLRDWTFEDDPQHRLDVEVSVINVELAKYLSKHPELLYQMSPRRFEELIAEILRDMGYEVNLTPATRDGGRDILAVFRVPIGEILTIVECKRFKPERKVGIDIVERFMFALDRKDNASFGVVATTSYFSPDARAIEKDFRWRLGLRDFNAIQNWLGKYGTWACSDSSGIWLPNHQISSSTVVGPIQWDTEEDLLS
jgi:restriction endonuclease Mrr